MKAKEIIWKEILGGLGPVRYRGTIGRIIAFSYSWNVMQSADRELPYLLHCYFVDLKIQRFKTEEELKEYAQKFLCYFVKEITED
jgi:hypothetical protein